MFNRTTTAPCIVPGPPVVDPRCLSAEFSLANPTLCPGGTLILKPSVAMLCQLESVEFRVFEYVQGVETELTTGIKFASSDNSILAIGVNSGNGTAIGTGLEAGAVTVTATHTDGRMAVAEATVLPGTRCCDEVRVLTAIVVDNSLSMSLDFNVAGFVTPYPKRLTFAKAMAASYGGVLYEVDGTPKDADRVWAVNETVTASFFGFSNNVDEITAAITAITQTQNKTDLLPVFTTITNDLLAETADRRVLLLISDGEHTSNTNRQAVLTAAATFKSLGEIVAIVGVRASGDGYDLLERLATPGFFLNSTASNASDVIGQFNYLKSLLCAGFCVPMQEDWVNQPALLWFTLNNWTVLHGQINLIGKDLLNLLGIEGLYLEMNGGGDPATIESFDTFTLVSGNDYQISFHAAGNQRQDIVGQGLKVYLRENGANDSDPNIFEVVVYPAWDSLLQIYSFAFNSTVNANAKLYVEQLFTGTAPTIGNLLDNVEFKELTTGTILLPDTFDTENLVYIPPRCGPSAELEAIPDPGIPTVEWVGDYGTDLSIDGQFNYGVSYVTNEGETAVSTIEYSRTDTNAHSQTARLFRLFQANEFPLTDFFDRLVSINIWRSLGEEAGHPTATNLFLLANVTPWTLTYLDQEDEEAFTARYEPTVEAPTVNTTAVASGGLGYGYAPCCYYDSESGEFTDNCPPCTAGTPGAQAADANPLPDIESGNPPPNPPVGNVEVCVQCPADYTNSESVILTQTGAENIVSGDPEVAGFYHYFTLTTALRVASFTLAAGNSSITFDLYGSADGTTWVKLGSYNYYAGGMVLTHSVTSPSAYLHYRVVERHWVGETHAVMILTALQIVRPTTPITACATAATTALATAAATALLHCVRLYSVTASYTARCTTGFGSDVTRSETRTSLNNQGEAQALAEAAAQEAAEAALDCEGSNNTQAITIFDSTGGFSKASPYPSVKFVEGSVSPITNVTVTIHGFTHPSPDDVRIILVSPAGTAVELMRNCGGIPLDGASQVTNLELVFSDAGGSFLPDGPTMVSGTFKPSQFGASASLPSPCPATPYDTTLSAFDTENQNGPWSLFVVDDLTVYAGTISGGWDLTISV